MDDSAKEFRAVLFGIRAETLVEAKRIVEQRIGGVFEHRDSSFHGGEYVRSERGTYEIRIWQNYFDDGDGYRWMWQNPEFQYIMDATAAREEIEELIRLLSGDANIALAPTSER